MIYSLGSIVISLRFSFNGNRSRLLFFKFTDISRRTQLDSFFYNENHHTFKFHWL
jgi:hypothetical protein